MKNVLTLISLLYLITSCKSSQLKNTNEYFVINIQKISKSYIELTLTPNKLGNMFLSKNGVLTVEVEGDMSSPENSINETIGKFSSDSHNIYYLNQNKGSGSFNRKDLPDYLKARLKLDFSPNDAGNFKVKLKLNCSLYSFEIPNKNLNSFETSFDLHKGNLETGKFLSFTPKWIFEL